jgi:hypothetical protein
MDVDVVCVWSNIQTPAVAVERSQTKVAAMHVIDTVMSILSNNDCYIYQEITSATLSDNTVIGQPPARYRTKGVIDNDR